MNEREFQAVLERFLVTNRSLLADLEAYRRRKKIDPDSDSIVNQLIKQTHLVIEETNRVIARLGRGTTQ